MHLLLFLLTLSAVFGACNEQGWTDVWKATEHPVTAWFQGGRSFALVDLDTGEWRVRRHQSSLVPYTYEELANGALLVKYVDETLRCGFLLLNEAGSVLYRKDGFAPYVFGEDIVLAVHLSEALEGRPAAYSAEVIDSRKPSAAAHYENTLALAPLGRDWRALQEPVRPLPLLVTYTPRDFGADYFYPWTKDLKASALRMDGSVAWISGIMARRLLTSIELLYTGQGIHLLYGKHDYHNGEYILLDAQTGRVTWHARNTIIPVYKTQFPYINFHDVLLVETQDGALRFPAYDSGAMELNVAEINLRNGGVKLADDRQWLAEVDRAYRQIQKPPAGVNTWSEKLGVEETLVLTLDSLSLSRGETVVWSRQLVPDFGEGLDFVVAGKELVLLVERPMRKTALCAQDVPHLIDRKNGRDVGIPVEGAPAVYRPLIIDEKLLVLTSDDARLFEWLPLSDGGAS